MGVTGLWRLVEPAGKPVPVETLENKVLAVDISIWLHQMVKGYQDAKGAPLPNAHLMGLFQRLCKLLYFRIKPVFVFDGAFPDLKKETIAKRQDSKAKYNSESERLKRELVQILSKKTAINSLLGKQISPKKSNNIGALNDDDIFKLPALPLREEENESESDDESSNGSVVDLHSVDVESDNFKSLPVKEKYDLLVELKETRKMNSWGRLHELPKKSDNFSDFQLQRLLKRRKVQECLEETEKEMGDCGMSLNDLESLLNEEGIDTKIDTMPTRRIASNNDTRFLLINNVKQALAEAKKKREAANETSSDKIEDKIEKPTAEREAANETSSDKIEDKFKKPRADETKQPKKDELEDDLEKAIKMSLECVDDADSSACASKTNDSWTSVMTMTDSDYTDSEEEDGYEEPTMTSAKAYIMQYSDFTPGAIQELVTTKKNSNKSKSKVPKVDQIINELNNEKSVIVDNIDLSSSDDDCIQEVSDSNNKITKDHNKSVVELNTTEDFESSVDDNLNVTQASVMCIENPTQDIITLDTSTEDDAKQADEPESTKVEVGLSEKETADTDSDEEDFEEVPDEALKKPTNPVVEFTVNIGEAPEDDIFADIFVEKDKPIVTEVKEAINIISGKVRRSEDFQEEKNLNEQNKTISFIELPSLKPVITANTKSNEKIECDILNKPSTSKAAIEYETKIMKQVFVQESKEQLNESGIVQPNEQSEIVTPPKESDIVKSPQEMEMVRSPKETEVTKPPKQPIYTENLNTMAEKLQNEEEDLLQEKGRVDRIGRNITEQMTKEAQELLQIFGIPYVVAPMEAEAQCAFLESVKLTDGTITDDSDIWLFGGRTVYKNFFNQKKHVLQFLAERIERSFNLTREQLVLLALLVGSDYTTGVTGVGPVTALEILASFPFNKKQFLNETSQQARYNQIVEGLREFKKWVRGGKRTDNTTLKKKLKNVDLTDDFPSVRVVQAYLEPNVEISEEKFTWGELDITVLRDYTKEKFGWSQNKLDEIIKPVLKRMLDRKSQRSVQDYFQRKVEFQSLEEQMSKRVKAAVQKMGPESIQEEDIAVINDKQKSASKRKAPAAGAAKAASSKAKLKKNNDENIFNDHGVKVVLQKQDGSSDIEIRIPKSHRVQEIIPQREKEKQSLLQNKMKAIEIFRKTKIDRKRKPMKRRANIPKDKAELSESSDSN